MCMCWVSDVRSSPWAFESSALTVIYLLQFCPSFARLTRDRRQSEVNFSFLCKMWKFTSTTLTATTLMPMTMLIEMIMTKLRWIWICHDGVICTVKGTSKIFSNVFFVCSKWWKGGQWWERQKKWKAEQNTWKAVMTIQETRWDGRGTRDYLKLGRKEPEGCHPFLFVFHVYQICRDLNWSWNVCTRRFTSRSHFCGAAWGS